MTAAAGVGTVRVGISPPPIGFSSHAEATRFLASAADAGIDHVFTADHVSFRGGHGIDGLVRLASLLGMHPSLGAYAGVYLLALRHPVVVARQLATISELAPGRLTFGVGIGGEDRSEIEACGVDPATRGRRTDEALGLLRALLAGESVDHDGEFFRLDGVMVLPPPDPPLPITVGGRSDAALRRAGRLADGWLASWCSPRRFAEGAATVARTASENGRSDIEWQHGYQCWVGVGRDVEDARHRLGPAMEAFYRVPFDRFERYSPAGPPEAVAAFLAPLVAAGATTLNLTPIASTMDDGIAAIGEVKRLLH